MELFKKVFENTPIVPKFSDFIRKVVKQQNIDFILKEQDFEQLKFLNALPQCMIWSLNGNIGYDTKLLEINEKGSTLGSDLLIATKMVELGDNGLYELENKMEQIDEADPKYKKHFLKRNISGFDKDEVMEFLDSIKYSMSKNSVIDMLSFIELVFKNKCKLTLVIVDKSLKNGKIRKHFNLLNVVPIDEGIIINIKYEYLAFNITHNNENKIYQLTSPNENSKTFQEIAKLLNGNQEPTNFEEMLKLANK